MMRCLRHLPHLFLQEIGNVLQGALRKVLDVSVCELLQYVYILLVKILIVVPDPSRSTFRSFGPQSMVYSASRVAADSPISYLVKMHDDGTSSLRPHGAGNVSLSMSKCCTFQSCGKA